MGRPGHILTLALVEPQYHNQWLKYQSSWVWGDPGHGLTPPFPSCHLAHSLFSNSTCSPSSSSSPSLSSSSLTKFKLQYSSTNEGRSAPVLLNNKSSKILCSLFLYLMDIITCLLILFKSLNKWSELMLIYFSVCSLFWFCTGTKSTMNHGPWSEIWGPYYNK